MFTGIIDYIGTLRSINRSSISIKTAYPDLKTGESIAIDGVCLTVRALTQDGFTADISEETLTTTTFSGFSTGSTVHCERALLPTSRMGGHMVQGHIDGIGVIKSIKHLKSSTEFEIQIPENLEKYCVQKGSIALDGISLTVASIRGTTIRIAVIPHTLAETHWHAKKTGSKVNVETDIMAKYVERHLAKSRTGKLFQKKELDVSMLLNGGFE